MSHTDITVAAKAFPNLFSCFAESSKIKPEMPKTETCPIYRKDTRNMSLLFFRFGFYC